MSANMEIEGDGSRAQHSRNEASPRAHDAENNSLSIITRALYFLKQVSENASESVESDSMSGAIELPVVQLQKILLRSKIKSCSEFLENLNKQKTGTNDLSYQSALVLIYVVETFALQGTGDDHVNDMLAKYLAPNYSTDIDREIFRLVRNALLKQPYRKLELKDVQACIIINIDNLFEELQKYTQHVLTGIDQACTQSTNNGHCTLDQLFANPKSKLGGIITNVGSFLATEFEKLLTKSFTEDEWTSTDLFEFVVNFFPLFKEKSEWNCKILIDLRNRLLHHFHEYAGCLHYGNEIVAMRHELLKYYLAKKVYKVVCDIKSTDISKEVDENLDKQCKIDIHQNTGTAGRHGGVPHATTKEKAKGFHGYTFSKSMLPVEIKNFEELVDHYLKFKFLTHHFMEKEDEVVEGDPEQQKKKNLMEDSQTRTKWIDSDRREMFEEFDKLVRLRTKNNKEYYEKKKRLKESLVNKYGVRENHFDETFKYFEEYSGKIIIKSGSNDAESVATILTTLQGILGRNPKLSNQVIISLYDRFVTRKAVFDSRESKHLLKNVSQDQELKLIETEMNDLPKDQRIKLQINDKPLFVPIGEVVKDILNIFCNVYDTYRVDFEIKDIFNDDTILDYMVRNETEEVDVVEFVDPYFKFIRRLGKNPSLDTLPCGEVVEGFLRLKQILKTPTDQIYYDNEKKKFAKGLANKHEVKETDFNEVCRSFVESDGKLTPDEINIVEDVRSVIRKLKNHSGKPSYSAIASSYKNVMNSNSFHDSNDEDDFIGRIPENEKKFAKLVIKFLNETKTKSRSNETLLRHIGLEFSWLDEDSKDSLCEQLRRGRVDDYLTKNPQIVANQNKSPQDIINRLKELYRTAEFEKLKLVGEGLGKIVGNVLDTFTDKLKLKDHNKERIGILLSINYTAPYIVRLLKNVNSDEIMEIDDLKKLIEILLNDQDNNYIRHLNDLLHINSGRLNLYKEVCTHIIKPSFNIENMLSIFNEPKHVDGILTALNEGNKLCDETVELLKKVFKLLNSVVLELIFFNKDDTALEMLSGKLQETFNCLINEKAIGINDPVYVDFQLNVVKVRNARGKKTNDRTLHEEALDILEKVHAKNDESNYSQYLLVLCHKAYTLKLLRRYNDSYKKYKDLYVEIVRVSLDRVVSDAYNTDNIHGKIEESEKYREIRESSEVSQRYLDILDIVHNIGHTILSYAITAQAKKKLVFGLSFKDGDSDSDSNHDYDNDCYPVRKTTRPMGYHGESQHNILSLVRTMQADRDTDFQNCEESLNIFNGLYEYTKEKFGSKHQDSVQLMRQLARAHCQTGKVILRHLKPTDNRTEVYRNVLQHLRFGLVVNNRILEIQLEKKNNYHIPVENIMTHFIVKNIFELAFIHNRLGWALERDDREKVLHHQYALNIYKMIHGFQKSIKCDQKDELKTLENIAFTYNNLGMSLHSDHVQKISSYRKALARYDEARELTENIHTSKSQKYLTACLNVAGIHSRLYYSMKSNDKEHYKESMKLCKLVIKNRQLARPCDISCAEKWINSLNNTYQKRSQPRKRPWSNI